MNQRGVGTYYEKRTAQFLEKQGYEILKRNYWCRVGEIDIIAKEGGELVFVEVKYRRDEGMENPKEAVDRRKQRRISMAASCYLMKEYGKLDVPCRFDVAAVLGERIELIKNAFEYIP